MADIFGDALAQATDGPGTAGTTVHTQVTEAAAIIALADQAWMVGMPQPETGIERAVVAMLEAPVWRPYERRCNNNSRTLRRYDPDKPRARQLLGNLTSPARGALWIR